MNNRQQVIARMRRQATGQRETLKEQMAVYFKQFAQLAQASYYMTSFPADRRLYTQEARKALGDLITQIQLSCEILGIDFEDVAMEGFLSFRDKMKEAYGSRKDYESLRINTE